MPIAPLGIFATQGAATLAVPRTYGPLFDFLLEPFGGTGWIEYYVVEQAHVPSLMRLLDLFQQLIDGADRAMSGNTDSQVETNRLNPGGIDLNAANLNLNIKRDGKGMPLPLAQQDTAQLSRIQGFVPHILQIRPAANLPILNELKSLVPPTVTLINAGQAKN